MPRYEFSEGTSNKFWDISLNGKTFTTTYGKIGTDGQSTQKSFGSDADAKKEYDKLVAEKVKKGYALAGGGGAAKKAAPAPVAAAPKKIAVKRGPAKSDDDDEEDEAPPAKAAKPAGGGGARYFEFSEGSSNKFWEITLKGSEVRTRYGKIGADGQTTLKEYDSPAAAKKEHDKLVAEKTKKGYEEGGGGGGGGDDDGDDGEGGGEGGPDARNPELEKAILADPDDADSFQVYADWLQGQGDPRGELIALYLGNKAKPAAALLAKHEAYFLGELSEHVKTHDGKDTDAFTWKHGFIHGARLSYDENMDEGGFEGPLVELLTTLLEHPSGRFLVELTLNFNGDPNEKSLQDMIDVLAKSAPKTLRKLRLGDFEYPDDTEMSWFNIGDCSKLWKALPGLKDLTLQGASWTLGTIDLPALERAEFQTGGLSKASAQAIAKAKWPKIQHLDIWYGQDNYGGDSSVADVKPLLARTDLRALRHLGLMNCSYTNELAEPLASSQLLPQLTELSLAMGVLTDEGATALAAHKDALSHLSVLDVSDCLLSDAGLKSLKGCAKKIVSTDQRDDDDPEYRYTSVGE